MRTHTSIGLFLFTVLLHVPFARAEQLLYLASTQEKSIVAHSIDPDTGKLTQRFRVELPGSAGPMAFSPDESFVYTAVTGLPDGKAGVDGRICAGCARNYRVGRFIFPRRFPVSD